MKSYTVNIKNDTAMGKAAVVYRYSPRSTTTITRVSLITFGYSDKKRIDDPDEGSDEVRRSAFGSAVYGDGGRYILSGSEGERPMPREITGTAGCEKHNGSI